MFCCLFRNYLCGPGLKHIFFDIDDTFFHLLSEAEKDTIEDKGSINIGIFKVEEKDIVELNESYFYLIGKDHYQAIFNELKEKGFKIGFCTTGTWINDAKKLDSQNNIHEVLKSYGVESSKVYNFKHLKRFYADSNLHRYSGLSIKRVGYSQSTELLFESYNTSKKTWKPLSEEDRRHEYRKLKHGFLQSLGVCCGHGSYLLVDNDLEHCINPDVSGPDYLEKAHHFRSSAIDFNKTWRAVTDPDLKKRYIFLDLCLGIERYFEMPLNYTKNLLEMIPQGRDRYNFTTRFDINHSKPTEKSSLLSS